MAMGAVRPDFRPRHSLASYLVSITHLSLCVFWSECRQVSPARSHSRALPHGSARPLWGHTTEANVPTFHSSAVHRDTTRGSTCGLR